MHGRGEVKEEGRRGSVRGRGVGREGEVRGKRGVGEREERGR